jgi:hypothetical protein
MRKLFVLPGAALIALLALTSPAAAHNGTPCTSEQTGVTIANVVVPANGACTLTDSTVTGNVKVKQGAFFQATNTDIAGKVDADRAQTLFIDTDSTVGKDVESEKTAQVFVFNATIGGDLEVERSTEVVQICGTTVERGDVEVKRSGTDLLIGDPQTEGCAGNTVSQGDVEIERNTAEIEFVVRGNSVSNGDMEVLRNTGTAAKFVEDNTGGDDLECWGNEDPFTASGNTGWQEREGQCAVVLVCEAAETGVDVDAVIVPDGASCTLTDSKVTEDVRVGAGAFFQATNTAIGGKVRAHDAQTLFIDTGSSVGRDVKSDGTAQVFVFNATVHGDLEVEETTEVVQICGNTVERGDIEVERSGTDLLIGDPQTEGCAGNTVSRGDLEVKHNTADVEFVVRGNTVSEGDLEVVRNMGTVPKFVQDNIGGDDLECFGNEDPFTASGNTGFNEVHGQCEEV